jgi:chromosome segregation ATPase
MTERGPHDLEERIDQLQKQKEYLQQQCRKAGKAILYLEIQRDDFKKELDRLSEEFSNYKIMKGDK